MKDMAFNQFPKVTTTFVDLLEYEAVNESGNKVSIDMYDADQKKAQSPMELLLSAVSACSAVDLVEILHKRKKAFSEFRVEAKGSRRPDHPRSFEHIVLEFIVKSDNISEEELEKNARLVVDKYCSVATTVSGNANIEVKVRVI